MAELGERIVELTRMRAGIGRRMLQSKRDAPHFYVQIEVAVDSVRERLGRLNDTGLDPPATMTVALARACVAALKEHPQFNRVWSADGLMQVDAVNLGVAIAVDEGVVAPALLDADSMDVGEMASALRDVAERARSQRLSPAEFGTATFTLSNLGMFDVTAFTAIIAPPQVAILATARPVERLVMRDGAPASVSLMTATLSADHRAVDGVDGARFLATFKAALEDCDSLLPDRLVA